MGGLDTDTALARAYLSRVAEPANIPVWQFVRRLGPIEAAERIRAGQVPAAVEGATASRRDRTDAQGDLDAADRHGIRLVTPESADWPHFAFAALEAAALARLARHREGAVAHRDGGEPIPPLALWVKGGGDLGGAGIRSVAIVGARAATAYGEQVTAELAYGVARADITVVSGGAFGIDAVAHRSALAAEGCSIIVSAGGLDRPYPAANAGLYERVAQSGLLICESPPGSAPQRHRFLTRNRLIAALSAGTVVVEAAARSGALNTAAHCQALGRPLMAVPGPITSALSVGCHQLLRREVDPAILVASVDEVLALVGSIGETTSSDGASEASGGSSGSAAGELRRRLDDLDRVARRVFDGLPPRRRVSAETWASLSGVTTLEVIRAIPLLELAGLIAADADGYRLAASARPRGGFTT